MIKRLSFLILLLVISNLLSAQENWKLNTRFSFYTDESDTEVLLVIPEDQAGEKVYLTLSGNGKLLVRMDTILPQKMISFPINLRNLEQEETDLVVWIKNDSLDVELRTQLVILPPKGNQVKVDRLTGGLIVGDRPYFPFGFYCYSPVQELLAEQEVVKGFNMMSPYQNITEKTLEDRQKYMDRCAQLGMKVHYNLLPLAGGGGVGSGRAGEQGNQQKRNRLISEVNHFKDHPALLGWYISDEPTGHGANPDSLKVDYELIKELDPYHPVTIVFMAPHRAREYADAMDIVMADPYPIPNQPVRWVGTVCKGLSEEFLAEKPVWLVPQAFGGSEHWSREPSLREVRAMTWLGIAEGVTGIQYFVRHGLNGFPKSTAMWGECGRMSLEIQEIAPFLLQGKPVQGFESSNELVRIRCVEFEGELLIIAVNEAKMPLELAINSPFSIEGAKLEVLYEDRELMPEGSEFRDMIDGMGRRVYLLRGLKTEAEVNPHNLILDPGFEDASSTGFPASCYASAGSDQGATYFLDAIEPFSGKKSLRVTTPTDNQGVSLGFFPTRLSSGSAYTLSVWARLDTNSIIKSKRNFFQRLFGKNKYVGSYFSLSAGTYGESSYSLSGEWENYKLRFRVPENGSETISINPRLEMESQGTVWFDQLELYPDPLIDYGVNPVQENFEISVHSYEPNTTLRYTLDGKIPDPFDPEIKEPLTLNETVLLTVGLFKDGELLNYSTKPFELHKAVGRKPVYQHAYAGKYTAGGEFGLVDGIKGSRDYKDGRWQGFMKRDCDVVIDLKSLQKVRKISIGCLQDSRSWIFMPTYVEFWGSASGSEFIPLGSMKNPIDVRAEGAIRHDYILSISQTDLRYIRVKATNLGLCPEWHNGNGNAAFLFVDEIIIE